MFTARSDFRGLRLHRVNECFLSKMHGGRTRHTAGCRLFFITDKQTGTSENSLRADRPPQSWRKHQKPSPFIDNVNVRRTAGVPLVCIDIR